MKLITSWRFVALTLLFFAGMGLFWGSASLKTWVDPQFAAYNVGVTALNEGKVDEAMVAFDKSLDLYKSGTYRSKMDSFLYPGRSNEIAALALSKKAILYIIKQKPDLAITAFKDSIALNPGGSDNELLQRIIKGEDLSVADVKRLSAQSWVVKHNLELMFKKNPSQQQKEGKGKGKGQGKGPPKEGEGNEPAQGTKPGPGSGKSNPNAI
jgi:tetratricopeptide (TPR) repeat protein